MPNDHEAAEAIAGLDGKELGGCTQWFAAKHSFNLFEHSQRVKAFGSPAVQRKYSADIWRGQNRGCRAHISALVFQLLDTTIIGN